MFGVLMDMGIFIILWGRAHDVWSKSQAAISGSGRLAFMMCIDFILEAYIWFRDGRQKGRYPMD